MAGDHSFVRTQSTRFLCPSGPRGGESVACSATRGGGRGEVVKHQAFPGESGYRDSLAEGLVRALLIVPKQPLCQLRVQQAEVRLLLPGRSSWQSSNLGRAVEPLRRGRSSSEASGKCTSARRQPVGELPFVLRAVVGEHPVHLTGEQVDGEVGEVPGPTGRHPRRGHRQAEPAAQVEAGEDETPHPIAPPRSRCPPPAPPPGRRVAEALGLAGWGVAGACASPGFGRDGTASQALGLGDQPVDSDHRRAAQPPPLVEPKEKRPPSRSDARRLVHRAALGLADAVVPLSVKEADGPDEAAPGFSRCGRRGRKRSPGTPARGRCGSRSRRGPPSRLHRARHNSRGPRRR